MTKTYDQYLEQFQDLKTLIDSPDTPTKVAANALAELGVLVGGAKFNQVIDVVDNAKKGALLTNTLRFILDKTADQNQDIRWSANQAFVLSTGTESFQATVTRLDNKDQTVIQNAMNAKNYGKYIHRGSVDGIYNHINGTSDGRYFQNRQSHLDIIQFADKLLVKPPHDHSRWDVYSANDSRIGCTSVSKRQMSYQKRYLNPDILKRFQENTYDIDVSTNSKEDRKTYYIAMYTGFKEALKQQKNDSDFIMPVTQQEFLKLGADKLLAPKL